MRLAACFDVPVDIIEPCGFIFDDKLLLRARAMDNQIYMAGCCAALDESIHWHSWGHSLVADPYADVLCEAGSGEEIVYADIDLARVDESRRAIPVGKLLRRDMYKVSD